MGYEIDVTSVTAVLLADGWHRVKGKSFGIEPYGYVATLTASPAPKKEGRNGKARTEPVPAVVEKGLPPVMGARWTKPNGEVIACPVASVLALRHGRAART
jgi:hypothetical protein